jgi:hypothetical protein
MYPNRWGYPVPGRGWRPCRCFATGNRSPVVPAGLRPWDQTTMATGSPEGRSRLPAVRQLPNAAIPGDVPQPLGVSGTGPGSRSPALPLLRHGEPASGCPAGLPAMRSGHRATGLPEGRSRPRAARQLLNAAVPGDVPPPLGVSGTGPGLAALPLLRHREPLSGCPCWPPAMRSDHHGHRLT